MEKIKKEELKKLIERADEYSYAIRKNIGAVFSVYTLRDALKFTHEDAKKTLEFLDSMGVVKKVDKKYQLLVTDKEQNEYLEGRIKFLREEAIKFNESAEYFINLQKAKKDA